MSLRVRAYYFDALGVAHDIPLASDLAGLESTRGSFFGSAFVRSCGARLLPRLNEQAILQIGGAELQVLRTEVANVQRAIVGREDAEYWAFRLANIDAAIDCAESHGSAGWVEIA